ncbi:MULTISPECIES: c-type cytochrome [Thiomicrorhabdus]|uniref:C-type cytochrome n=1 Tax=Thiomicrorhabdus xiamenensis TaxID=2739063 RepID=A0A7D4NQ63_9GAMM|nr:MULTISPECIES: c-type cytochrome [Thiomicrorhabdus]MBO1923823.1 c-type cytochrome [Thiomicrorhabdus sp. 6S3-12]QKI88577.1 c-type cytochrome [Thiomicrorhabdus xiamenensis]
MQKTLSRLAKIMAIAAIAPLSSAAQAGEISNAELSATTCFQCHGAEGKASGGSIPPLAGYPEKVMVQQLLDMKSGKRASTVMGRHALGYSDDEIRAIAKYLGSLKP